MLRDADQAFDAAKATALDLMRENAGTGVQWLSCRFEVRDSAGTMAFEFPFSEAVEVPPKAN